MVTMEDVKAILDQILIGQSVISEGIIRMENRVENLETKMIEADVPEIKKLLMRHESTLYGVNNDNGFRGDLAVINQRLKEKDERDQEIINEIGNLKKEIETKMAWVRGAFFIAGGILTGLITLFGFLKN